jgi:hypothetical protein
MLAFLFPSTLTLLAVAFHHHHNNPPRADPGLQHGWRTDQRTGAGLGDQDRANLLGHARCFFLGGIIRMHEFTHKMPQSRCRQPREEPRLRHLLRDGARVLHVQGSVDEGGDYVLAGDDDWDVVCGCLDEHRRERGHHDQRSDLAHGHYRGVTLDVDSGQRWFLGSVGLPPYHPAGRGLQRVREARQDDQAPREDHGRRRQHKQVPYLHRY